MAVLVTGATGFVGTWLVRRLIEQGERVHVLHRRSSNLGELTGLDFVSAIGDVTDAESVRKACQDVETVFHLAGVVGYSRAMRSLMESVNVEGTRHVAEALRGTGKRLIYMSSVVAVGASIEPKALNEESPYTVGPLNLGYFETKKKAEDLVMDFCNRGELNATMVNPSTIYGPGDAKKGSRKTQIKVAQGKFPFYTSGGVSVVSVHDVVDAVLAARTKGRVGHRYILSGENMTIHDLFNRIASLAGVPAPWLHLPNPVVRSIGFVGDIFEKLGKKGPLTSENAWTSILFHWFDCSKAKAELGFNPRPAQQALSESVEWMKQHGIIK